MGQAELSLVQNWEQEGPENSGSNFGYIRKDSVQEKNVWWTNELNKLRKHTRRRLRALLQNNVLANWDSYREAQGQYKKAVRQVKVNSWRRFCEPIDKTPDLSGIRKILARDRGAQEELFKLPTGTFQGHRKSLWVYSMKVSGFPIRDLVAKQVKCRKCPDQNDIVIPSAYLPSDSMEMPLPTEFKKLVEYWFEKKLELLVENDANTHRIVWGSS